MRFLPLLMTMFGAVACVAMAQDPVVEPLPEEVTSDSSLAYQTGVVELEDGIARLELAEGFRYLAPADARPVLDAMGGDPPGTAAEFLGMVIAPDEDPETRGAWVSVLSYSSEGHLSDQDIADVKDPLLLEYLKGVRAKENESRKAQGKPDMELMGWAQIPVYSRATHVLNYELRYWNERARSGEESVIVREHWLLGRRGKIIVGTVAPSGRRGDSSDLGAAQIAGMIHFNPGHGHEAFNPKSDSRAQWPATLQFKEAAAESKSALGGWLRRKYPIFILILVAFLVKKGIDRFREA